MSHGDAIMRMPPGYTALAHSENSPYAAIGNESRAGLRSPVPPRGAPYAEGEGHTEEFSLYDLQGEGTILRRLVHRDDHRKIREEVDGGKVVCALSGGVDSSVVATLLHKAIGDKLTCVFVNNGVLRKNEGQEVLDLFKDRLHLNLKYVDGSDRFLAALKGVRDPEKKAEDHRQAFHKGL